MNNHDLATKSRRTAIAQAMGVIFSAFTIQQSWAQSDKKVGSGTGGGGAEGLDASPGVIEDVPFNHEHARVAATAKGESFYVITGSGGRTLVSVVPDRNGDALVTINGATSRVKERDNFYLETSVPNKKLTSSSFWACFAACMIKAIGIGAWNNIKANYLSIWNSTAGIKPWYKRLIAILKQIFTLPYAAYALQCVATCK